MYRMFRVYCGAPWELDDERMAFYDTVGQFNETQAMQRGILFVPVALGNVASKRPLQYAVNHNIRTASWYVQLLDTAPLGGWGPPDRNFEPDYRLALECLRDPALPMAGVAILLKAPVCPPPGIAPETPPIPFATTAEFSQKLLSLCAGWLEAITAPRTAAAGSE